MEWPTIDVLSSASEHQNRDANLDILTSEDEQYLEQMTITLITKEIYARAAKAAIANILVDHESSGLKDRVELFLEHLRNDDDHWNTEYRSIAREFTELMAASKPRSVTLDICRAGLDSIHDLLKYRLPREKRSRNRNRNNNPDTVLAAKDAFVLCQSLDDKLHTQSATGTRAPDLDYRFGLLTGIPQVDTVSTTTSAISIPNPNNNNNNNNNNDGSGFTDDFAVYGQTACSTVASMRKKGQLETSAASLANYTFMCPDIVHKLGGKIFVVIGCDHPLSPTRSLLRIPGVTVLGIPSHKQGLNSVLEYTTYNTPDDTSFLFPSLSRRGGGDDGNLVLSRGPHVAQWILEQTKQLNSNDQDNNHNINKFEIVLVPMPLTIRPDQSTTRSREAAIRWEASSDLIVQRVLRARSSDFKCTVWSYQSSTTCMVVPSASNTKSIELLENRPSHEPWLHTLSRNTVLTPVIDENHNTTTTTANTKESQSALETQTNTLPEEDPPVPVQRLKKGVDPNANHDYTIVNGILSVEGPHHVLAEHIRLWRAMVTNFPDEYHRYGGEGDDSESDDDDDDDPNKNIHLFAPYVPMVSPDLVSSTNNAHLLDPLKIFDAGSGASLLCAVSLAGILDPIINRPMPVFMERYGSTFKFDNIEPTTPFAMFWNGSVHGGIWNCPYTLDSASGTVGYVLGKVYEYYYYYYSSTNKNINSNDSAQVKTDAATDADGTAKTVDESQTSIVDVVPTTGDTTNSSYEDMPDYVHERLVMMANP